MNLDWRCLDDEQRAMVPLNCHQAVDKLMLQLAITTFTSGS